MTMVRIARRFRVNPYTGLLAKVLSSQQAVNAECSDSLFVPQDMLDLMREMHKKYEVSNRSYRYDLFSYQTRYNLTIYALCPAYKEAGWFFTSKRKPCVNSEEKRI
jgi:hypothetical protein